MSYKLTLSPLGHTWLLDLDGTILKHNGYKIDGFDSFVPGAKELLASIPKGDKIVIITSRTEEYSQLTEGFLRANGVPYDNIIYNAPFGERIVINDRKPSGLNTAVAVNLERDMAFELVVEVDENL